MTALIGLVVCPMRETAANEHTNVLYYIITCRLEKNPARVLLPLCPMEMIVFTKLIFLSHYQ